MRHDHGVCLSGCTETTVSDNGTSDVETAGGYSEERNEILSASFEIRFLILKLQLRSVLLPRCSKWSLRHAK